MSAKTQKNLRKEELEEIVALRSKATEVAKAIGYVELNKAQFVVQLDEVNGKMQKWEKAMEKKYGEGIQISLETGAITRPEKKA